MHEVDSRQILERDLLEAWYFAAASESDAIRAWSLQMWTALCNVRDFDVEAKS